MSAKGIDKERDVFNTDARRAGEEVYSDGVHVFVTHGSGKMWTLKENQRAWSDWVFTPRRMSGIVRDEIDLSVELFGEKLPHPIIVAPFGSHGPASGSGPHYTFSAITGSCRVFRRAGGEMTIHRL